MTRPHNSNRVLIHISPHPDDEALGSPGVLLALRAAGWHVVNFVASMGRPGQRRRRSGEAACAAQIAGFELRSPPEPVGLSRTDDLDVGYDRICGALQALFEELRPEVVVAPSPHDGHHAHELVSRAVLETLGTVFERPRLWLWGLWSDLPFPTIYAPYGVELMHAAEATLRCYGGELDRNNYGVLLPSRARANAVLGVERVFGYGEARSDDQPYADLLMECLPGPSGWALGTARSFSPDSEPVACEALDDIGWWLRSTSPHERWRLVQHQHQHQHQHQPR